MQWCSRKKVAGIEGGQRVDDEWSEMREKVNRLCFKGKRLCRVSGEHYFFPTLNTYYNIYLMGPIHAPHISIQLFHFKQIN